LGKKKQNDFKFIKNVGDASEPPPAPIEGIERKKWLKLLGVTFEDEVCCWDLHVDGLLSKARPEVECIF
jgi:hypothetical protein